jgi:acetylornithine deacetylase
MVAAADEEYRYRGVLKLCEGMSAAAAVVAEPTSLRLVTAHKGCLRFQVRTRGVAAHSSKPELGVNAIAGMARVVLALERHSAGLARRSHPLVGSPTCNVGIIRGGTQVNMVPESCSIEVDRRTLPGEDLAQVVADYDGLIAEIPGAVARRDGPLLDSPGLETPVDSPVAAVAARVLGEMGLNAAPAGVPYGSDASKLARAGIPGVVLGPGSIDQAHAAVEYVDCGEVQRALEFYRAFLMAFE